MSRIPCLKNIVVELIVERKNAHLQCLKPFSEWGVHQRVQLLQSCWVLASISFCSWRSFCSLLSRKGATKLRNSKVAAGTQTCTDYSLFCTFSCENESVHLSNALINELDNLLIWAHSKSRSILHPQKPMVVLANSALKLRHEEVVFSRWMQAIF